MEERTGGAFELLLVFNVVDDDVEAEDDVDEVEESVFVAGFEAEGRGTRNTGGARIAGG